MITKKELMLRIIDLETQLMYLDSRINKIEKPKKTTRKTTKKTKETVNE